MANENRILIYFDELVMMLTKAYSGTMDTHIYSPREILSSMQGLSPADAVEVVHGRWITEKCDHVPWRIKNPEKWVIHKCSVCGYSNGRKHSNYCPNCGAKMDGEETVAGADEKIVWAISTIERALGVIEGVSEGAKIKYADYLLGAVTMIEKAVKVITDEKRKTTD